MSVVFHPTTSYYIYHNLLHQAYQCLFNPIIQEGYHHYLSSKPPPRIVPPVFLNRFYKNSTTSSTQAKQNPRILPPIFLKKTTCYPKKEKLCIEKVTTRRTYAPLPKIKSKSVYVWYNVDNIIQRIESRIDLNSHTTYLYNSQFFSKEHENCSLQYWKCIRKLANMKKPLGVGYGFKSHCFPLMNVYLSVKVYVSLEDIKMKLVSQPFRNGFLPSPKISY